MLYYSNQETSIWISCSTIPLWDHFNSKFSKPKDSLVNGQVRFQTKESKGGRSSSAKDDHNTYYDRRKSSFSKVFSRKSLLKGAFRKERESTMPIASPWHWSAERNKWRSNYATTIVGNSLSLLYRASLLNFTCSLTRLFLSSLSHSSD